MLEFSPPPDFVNAQKLISGFGSPVDSAGVRRPDLLVDVRGGGPPWGHFQASVHSAKLAWDVCVTVDSAHVRARDAPESRKTRGTPSRFFRMCSFCAC